MGPDRALRTGPAPPTDIPSELRGDLRATVTVVQPGLNRLAEVRLRQPLTGTVGQRCRGLLAKMQIRGDLIERSILDFGHP